MTTRILLLMMLSLATTARGASFDEIEFWVGDGANQAALVIDWDEHLDAGPSLLWGYRWDGVASGQQMLLEVLQSDERLFAKISPPSGLGVSIYGLGYDGNGDQSFSLDDNTAFDSDGVATSGPSDFASATDPLDHYAEGWQSAGFWHYTNAPPLAQGEDTPQWVSAPLGIADRVLSDGDWDGLVFTSYQREDGSPKTFPELLASAPHSADPSPSVSIPGDYNRDGLVDAADYTAWRDALGSTPVVHGAQADGDFSGAIDASDYTIWSDNFGNVSTPARVVPEPASYSICFLIQLVFIHLRTRRVS